MASGSPVLQVLRVMPPATSFAYPLVMAGASTPAERAIVYAFPDAATYLDFLVALKGYAGGGLTLRLMWSASVNANNAVWQAAFRRIEDDAEDMDTTAFTYDYNVSAAATAPSVVGEVSYDNITFTNGADMDSLADGEMGILRIKRDPAHASDSLAAAAIASLWGFIGYET